MASHFIAFVLSICSVVLLLLANIGTTFPSSVLNKFYLVELTESVTGRSIRYGVYSSCLYYSNSTQSCTSKEFAYSFDTSQFAIACGADSTNSSMVSEYANVVSSSVFNTLFKFIVLIMPSAVLAFVSLCFTSILRKGRKNNVIPLVGAFVSLLSFFTGAAGLALVIATFWKGLDLLESRIEGLSHQWGPSIYMVGIGIGCILGTFICFIISVFHQPNKRDTFNLMDYSSSTQANDLKHESYKDNNYLQQPTTHYPSYHHQPETHYPSTTYHQTDTYHHDTYTPQVYEQIYDHYAPSPQAYNSQQAYNYPQQAYQGEHYDQKKPNYV